MLPYFTKIKYSGKKTLGEEQKVQHFCSYYILEKTTSLNTFLKKASGAQSQLKKEGNPYKGFSTLQNIAKRQTNLIGKRKDKHNTLLDILKEYKEQKCLFQKEEKLDALLRH